MLLKVTHKTDLAYSDFISESVMELRMAPRQEEDQHRLSFSLAIGPKAGVTSYFDWLGNTVHAFSVTPFHQRIQIVATSVVEIDRPKAEPEKFPDVWPANTADYTIYDYMAFGGPVVDDSRLAELARAAGAVPGMPLGQLAMNLLNVVHTRFTYEKGVTNAASPITEMLQHGGGVCQDFTHLMIAVARHLQIPARYVSGFLHKDGDRLRGYTQSHAWCELMFPSYGWIGFDPTNNCVVGPNFIKVAIGRDFRDVSPNKGVYRGKATETIDVAVTTDELPMIPPELSPEIYRGIDLPSYTDHSTASRASVTQQQEHQQQQEQQLYQQQSQQQQ